MRDLFVIPLPELEVGHEFGFVIAKPRMGKLCRLACLHGAVARILHGERRGNDEKLGHALLLARGKNHPAKPRIYGKFRQCPPCLGQLRALPGIGRKRAQLL